MAGYIGSTPVPQGIQEQQSFTVTNSSGQTTFNTLGYSDGNTIKVTLNGSLLEGGGVDYTATNGSDIVLTTAASVDDVLTFETLNEFNLVNQNLTTPTFTDSATVTSTTTASVSVSGDTTATLSLKNNTHEDTDNGRESTVIFQGEQSGGEISTLAEIEASHDGTADDEKANLIFRTNDGSDGASPTERLRIDSTGKSTFKDDVGIEGETPTLQMYDTNVTNNVMDASYDEYLTLDIDPNNARGNSGLIVKTDNTEKLRLTDGGNLAIKKDNTAIDTRLHIDNCPDSKVITFEQAGRKNAIGNYYSSGSTASRMDFFLSNGNVNGTNNTKLSILSGGGITFNGDTAAANALDDYEEGTFNFEMVGYYGSPSPKIQIPAHYTKIGNTVHFWALKTAINSTSYSGNMWFTGLPFTSPAPYAIGNISLYYIGTYTGYGPHLLISGNTAYAVLHQSNASSWSAVMHNVVSSGGEVYLAGTYKV